MKVKIPRQVNHARGKTVLTLLGTLLGPIRSGYTFVVMLKIWSLNFYFFFSVSKSENGWWLAGIFFCIGATPSMTLFSL